MAFYIDADERDRTSTDKTTHESMMSYKPPVIRTVQLVELTDECIDKIANKVAQIVKVKKSYMKNISETGFLCSECGFGDFDGFHGYEPKYCPNCGLERRNG